MDKNREELKNQKDDLRNKLFEKYFENKEGITLTELVEKLNPITEIWKRLHTMLEQNVKHYEFLSPLRMVKIMENQEKEYLIIKIDSRKYIIIDIENNQTLEEEEVKKSFGENFFVTHFGESEKDAHQLTIFPYVGDIQKLVSFVKENQNPFNISVHIYYHLEIGEAQTSISINLVRRTVQLGFRTPDKFLYECLFFEFDLSPYGLQDAHEKIGIEKMQEMIERVKEIKVPLSVLPKELFPKEVLRNALFEKYFEEEPERIKLVSLKEDILYVSSIWNSLTAIFQDTIKDAEWHTSLEQLKFVELEGTIYLVIKARIFKYLIIDVKAKRTLMKEEITSKFDKEFFVNHFSECKEEISENDWFMYHFLSCKKSVEELCNFCLVNKEILESSFDIYCKFEIGEAWTFLSIHPSNNKAMLGFQTPDQFLYEQLILHLDLTPSLMQDAQDNIDSEKMQEIFAKVEEIKIPKKCVSTAYLDSDILKRERKRMDS